MKKIASRLTYATFLMWLVATAFVAFNEKYTLLDATKCLHYYFGEGTWKESKFFPIGVTSEPVKDLPAKMSFGGGGGMSNAGDTLTIHLMPDIFPVTVVFLAGITVIFHLVWLVGYGLGSLSLWLRRHGWNGLARPAL
ncbi:MAG TPA: hypothetical protein VJH94_01155 [Candidatus Paceibacterota bacterium]